MSTDRSLATLLRALQSPSPSPDDASRLLSSATTLLTLLTNQLNLTLLTTHLLSAPAIWSASSNLRSSLRVLTAFHAASAQILQRDTRRSAHQQNAYTAVQDLPKEEWVRAVVKGADERSEQWKHILVLGGLLTGFEAYERRGLSEKLRKDLERAVVTAANQALNDDKVDDDLATNTTCLVLGHCFDLLGDFEKDKIDIEKLLSPLIKMIYFSREGLQWGYFLGTMDADVVQEDNEKFNWSGKSSTFYQVRWMATGPTMSTLGALSRIAAFCVDRARDTSLLFTVVETVAAFSRSICVQWRQNKLSELDATEEDTFLAEEAIKTTLPLLWQVLKSTMFSVTIIQSALLSRVLGDRSIPTSQAPFIATQTLHALRNLYFVSSRLGHNSFTQFVFVYTACIDVLSQYSLQAEAFLQEIRPSDFGRIPDHPHERCRDLFFLNTAEHFTLELPPAINEDLLLGVAAPYFGVGSEPRLLEIFEAAHSVALAVFSAPQNFAITGKHLSSYVDALFQVFPHALSARQFRLAVRTLVRITSSPSPISQSHPHLSSTLLELVRHRSTIASTASLPSTLSSLQQQQSSLLNGSQAPTPPPFSPSEQAVLVLALLDSLPCLPVTKLSQWLPLAAEAMNGIQETDMLEHCRERFWTVLSGGEMDVRRAEVCVAWWTTEGGREMVVHGRCLEALVEGEPGGHEGMPVSGTLAERSRL